VGAIVSIPLLLTLSRVLLGPLFIIIYIYGTSLGWQERAIPWVLLSLTILSELSDLFDGWFARKHNKVTELGKLLDPMADSIFRFSALIAFTQGPVALPLILVAIFFYRDTIIGTLRTVCALGGFALAARWSGKVKAVIQATVIFFILILMIPYSMGCLEKELLQALSFYAVLLSCLYTLYSGAEYLIATYPFIQKTLSSFKKKK